MARIIDGENTNIVGRRVRDLRKKKRMSQQALSNKLELLGVYLSWIDIENLGRVENGDRYRAAGAFQGAWCFDWRDVL